MHRLGWIVLFGLASAGCSSLGPPPAELEGPLSALAADSARRHKARVEISSDWFSGEFNAVAISRPGEDRAVRFQLIPDFGGKILDLVARPRAVIAHWPHNGRVERERQALIGFLCVSLLEQAAPISWDRVLGGKQTSDGFTLELRPASRDLDLSVHVDLTPEAELIARHYRLGFVRWTEHFQPEHRVSAPDFSWVFTQESRETIPPPPESLFDLQVQEESER